MKVSLEWLKEYVALPSDLTAEQVMHDLTLATVEVEGVEFPADKLSNVVVAQVQVADRVEGTKLTHTRCDIGAEETLEVVCGANNVRVGMRVALALPGAEIYPKGAAAPLVVGSAKVRGINSEAVICAANEIGLTGLFTVADDGAILDLDELNDVALGTPLAQCIGFEDAVFEIDNKSLTNRPDLWGHYGLARELAAIYDAELAELPAKPDVAPSDVLLSASDATVCNRFTATVYDDVRVERAPLMMRSRLVRVGQRAIDVVVDLTNYVMFATGQPSHAYDADRVAAPMCARRGAEGESVVLLDGSQVDAHPAAPFIADSAQALAVAGVMGGEASGVSQETTRLFLEMANFDARVVRGSSQHTGARTDASSRFEKALDTQRIDQALGLFHHLLAQVQGGARAVAHQDEVYRATAPTEITVGEAFINTRLGVEFAPRAVERSLGLLGFDVQYSDGEFSLRSPTWRSTGDVSLPADIVEEVARLHGYDNFLFVAPRVALQQIPRPKRINIDRQIRELLASAGLQEIFTYPWTRDPLMEAAAASVDQFMTLEAPPAPDLARLRPSLMPNLLEAAVTNLRFFDEFGIFEVGGVYPGEGERTSAAALMAGADGASLFRGLRGAFEHVERVGQLQGISLRVAEGEHDWADPSAALAIYAGETRIGTMARLSNRSKRLAGIKRAEVVGFEFSVAEIEGHPSRENRYRRIPSYPRSWFDVTIVVPDTVRWTDIQASTRAMDPLLTDVRWVGEYRGKGVPEGHRSLTLRLEVGSDERTLVSEESEAVRVNVVRTLEKKFGALQR